MAVVTRYTNGYPQQAAGTGYSTIASKEAKAGVNAMSFNIAAANGDSIASVYKLGRLPSNAIILPISTLYCPAIAGLTSVSVGLDNLLGTKVAAALMSAVSIAAGGSFSMVSAITAANYLQRVWQLLGLAADPGQRVDVYASLGAAATASGAITGFLYYLADGQ